MTDDAKSDETNTVWKDLAGFGNEKAETEILRQDILGIKSEFSDKLLTEASVSEKNLCEFYDFNVYLPQILLQAEICNPKFQETVCDIFTKDICKKLEKNILIQAGPVKRFLRCQEKVSVCCVCFLWVFSFYILISDSLNNKCFNECV